MVGGLRKNLPYKILLPTKVTFYQLRDLCLYGHLKSEK